MGGKVNYVLEGNINYTGAVITWLEKELKMIASAKETDGITREAPLEDMDHLVPVFTGLETPYWDSRAAAYAAGIGLGIYDREELFSRMERTAFVPCMSREKAEEKYKGWKDAVNLVLGR